MKSKLIAGLMVTLFLVNLLTMVGSVSAPIPGDITGDDKVTIVDVIKWALAFGSQTGESNWDLAADLNLDGIINIADGVMIAVHFGEGV